MNFPDNIYRVSRDRGLFILHLVKAKAPTGKENDKNVDLIPSQPVIGWGISLPVSARPAERVEYVVNTVRYKELLGKLMKTKTKRPNMNELDPWKNLGPNDARRVNSSGRFDFFG